MGFFAELGVIAAVLAVFTIMLSDFFDTMGTAVGLGRQANLLDAKGGLPDVDKILLVDSGAAGSAGSSRPPPTPPISRAPQASPRAVAPV